MNYYVYFAKSHKNGKVYVGFISSDPNIRVEQHNKGSNKYTIGIKPLELVYFETYSCPTCAKKRDKFYKQVLGRRLKSL